MAKSCPACGNRASGRFCSQCGTSLEAERDCTKCGNRPPPGARFCNMCGTSVATGTPQPAAGPAGKVSAGRSMFPWLIGGAGVLLIAVVVAIPRLRTPAPQQPTTPAAPGLPGNPEAVDLASMTPRQAADSLFDRVMRNASAGDSTGARMFVPMALAAYDLVENLDLDGHYHMAVLHLVNNDAPATRDQAERILEQTPTHLFGLFTAAQAEEMMGNVDQARSLYQRFLDNYEVEQASGRSEYLDHALVMPGMLEDAGRATQEQ